MLPVHCQRPTAEQLLLLNPVRQSDARIAAAVRALCMRLGFWGCQ